MDKEDFSHSLHNSTAGDCAYSAIKPTCEYLPDFFYSIINSFCFDVQVALAEPLLQIEILSEI
jgi:hypothetical protein